MDPEVNNVELAILNLRKAVGDLNISNELLSDDLYLLRWLKAQHLDVKKAAKMLKESMKWRKEKEDWINQEFHSEMSTLGGVIKTRCHNGAPIAFVDAGKVDLKKYIEMFGKDETYKLIMQHMLVDELTNIRWNREVFNQNGSSHITESSIEGNVLVIDVKHASYRQVSSIKAMQLTRELTLDYLNFLPVLGSVLIIINCSRIILPFVNLLKAAVEGPNLTIEVYDGNEGKRREALLKRVTPQHLPEHLGGNFK